MLQRRVISRLALSGTHWVYAQSWTDSMRACAPSGTAWSAHRKGLEEATSGQPNGWSRVLQDPMNADDRRSGSPLTNTGSVFPHDVAFFGWSSDPARIGAGNG